jgi:hypothetical protein
MFALGLEEVQFPNYMQCFHVLRTTSHTGPIHVRLQLKLVGISMNVSEAWSGEDFCDL